ncbi:MAG: GNAT family N-acetyltransferase [Ignavibacteria bacterium]
MNGMLAVRSACVARPRAAPVEVSRLCGMTGLAALRDEWAALSAALRDRRFHHEHAWHAAVLAHLERRPDELHFFAFRRAGRTIGIFPLRRALRTLAGVELAVWELPFAPHIDLCDVLAARDEDSAALLSRLVRELARHPAPSWDALHLPHLLDNSVALRALQAAPVSFAVARSASSMHFPCDDLDTALRNVAPAFARNLRRQRRKLEQYGRVAMEVVREPGALDAALAEFLRIEASGWKGGCRSAIALNPGVEAFYRELARRFGAERRCAINLLTLSGRPIAAQFALISGRRMNLLKIAYDEAYADAAPGSRLLHDVLAWCCDSAEIGELNLVTGPAWAAGRWNPDSEDVWTGWVFNTTPRGMAAYMATRAKPVIAAARSALVRPRADVRDPAAH